MINCVDNFARNYQCFLERGRNTTMTLWNHYFQLCRQSIAEIYNLFRVLMKFQIDGLYQNSAPPKMAAFSLVTF